LEFVDGFLEAVAAAEGFEWFDRSTHCVERRETQDERIIEVRHALVLVFLEQRFEYGTRLPAVSGKDIALAHVARALAPGKRRLIESDVADEIERIEILADFLSGGRSGHRHRWRAAARW
jgi:hypothetical protein